MERTMSAVSVLDDGSLAIVQLPLPDLRPGEVLVRVHAAGVNRADLSQRAGTYPPPPGESAILGLEVSGEVVAVTPDVASRGGEAWLGRRVMVLLAGGGYAEYVAAPADLLLEVPSGWSMDEAAGFPETAFTAYLNLFLEASLRPGERVLVHAGASGVGTAAIAMAKAVGCEVFTTVGGPDKARACAALGADVIVDRHAEDFASVVEQRTAGQGVDVVLDVVGGSALPGNVASLRVGGRLVVIATLGGRRGELDLATLMRKRGRVIGSVLRARPTAEKVQVKRSLLERFGPRIDDGTLRPWIDRSVPWHEVEEAHARMRENRNVGKIVLRVAEAGAPSA